ncbi:MAG: hypothetical protein QF464_22780 [Myxococcota bacterium]|nr:hypothetical protein [Myxococcota bacterium]
MRDHPDFGQADLSAYLEDIFQLDKPIGAAKWYVSFCLKSPEGQASIRVRLTFTDGTQTQVKSFQAESTQ